MRGAWIFGTGAVASISRLGMAFSIATERLEVAAQRHGKVQGRPRGLGPRLCPKSGRARRSGLCQGWRQCESLDPADEATRRRRGAERLAHRNRCRHRCTFAFAVLQHSTSSTFGLIDTARKWLGLAGATNQSIDRNETHSIKLTLNSSRTTGLDTGFDLSLYTATAKSPSISQ